MSVIRWEDPSPAHASTGRPKRPRRGAHWRQVAADLRAKPQEWAVLLQAEGFGNGGGTAGQIKTGKLAAFRPAGAFEATTRNVGGLYTVYARYIGEPADDAE